MPIQPGPTSPTSAGSQPGFLLGEVPWYPILVPDNQELTRSLLGWSGLVLGWNFLMFSCEGSKRSAWHL